MKKLWYTIHEVAAVLHVQRMTAWRLLRPHRARCHLARAGSHPRLVLWVPAQVVRQLEADREMGSRRPRAETPVNHFSP